MQDDVIDVARCLSEILDEIETVAADIARRRVEDRSGGRMAVVLEREAFEVAERYLAEIVRVDACNAPSWFVQFPEMLRMPIRDGVAAAAVADLARRALMDRVKDGIRAAVVAQHARSEACDVHAAAEHGLAMFSKYLRDDPYAPLRIRPSKLRALAVSCLEARDAVSVARLGCLLDALASELSSRPADARDVARRLREAAQHCRYAASGENVASLSLPADGRSLAA
jgi:hypothetical protein